jgi:hypothetical protein
MMTLTIILLIGAIVAFILSRTIMKKHPHHHHMHEDKLVGFLTASAGEGEVSVQLDFEPFDMSVDFTDEDPVENPSCNPFPNDYICIEKVQSKGKWFVRINWRVSAERDAEWVVHKLVC